MTKLEVEEFEDIKSGYRIKFFFDDNPYFENEVLVKEFHLGTSGDPDSKSSDIKWKVGSELASRLKEQATRSMKNRGRMDQVRTFFTWFLENGDASSDDIAEVIKDDMWPNPLQYFLVPDMEGAENGMVGEEDDEDDSGNDDSDDDDGPGAPDESVVVVEEDDDDDDEDGIEAVDDEDDGEDFDDENEVEGLDDDDGEDDE